MSSSNLNCSVTSHEFTVKFRGVDELFYVELNDNLRSLFTLKDKIQVMYHFKYARHIQIDKLGYYEPFIDLGCDRVEKNFDDATRKYDWKQLKTDEDVVSMFNSALIDPKYPALYATLIDEK
ncbi:hypothetical protein QL285_005057 [Trifolium repens]|jgi:hypothetical protein|nr:hypothetical protein QL285_096816 [Trifolium repens]KAK2421242.1 hypothetical protein QL285_031893 [Trifolium repens]KAK2457822.1 hypothetical protein QL285_005057 [Trifolium repens]